MRSMTIDKGSRYVTKRWVVIERTNSWQIRFRKILGKDYEKKSENYLALICLTSLYYCLHETSFGIVF